MNKVYFDTLAENRMSNTKSRRAVFSTLHKANTPLSIREIINQNEHIDRVTIYRIIDAFEEVAIVKKIWLGWKYKIELGDAFHHHHHHMTCTSCRVIISFEESKLLDTELHSLGKQHGFEITSHNLELKGLCSNCQL